MLVSPIVRGGVIAALVAVTLAGCEPLKSPMATAAVTAPPTRAATAAADLPNFAAIAERYGPAVVNISTTRMEKTTGLRDQPFFRFFFREFPFQPEQPMRIACRATGATFPRAATLNSSAARAAGRDRGCRR